MNKYVSGNSGPSRNSDKEMKRNANPHEVAQKLMKILFRKVLQLTYHNTKSLLVYAPPSGVRRSM